MPKQHKFVYLILVTRFSSCEVICIFHCTRTYAQMEGEGVKGAHRRREVEKNERALGAGGVDCRRRLLFLFGEGRRIEEEVAKLNAFSPPY